MGTRVNARNWVHEIVNWSIILLHADKMDKPSWPSLLHFRLTLHKAPYVWTLSMCTHTHTSTLMHLPNGQTEQHCLLNCWFTAFPKLTQSVYSVSEVLSKGPHQTAGVNWACLCTHLDMPTELYCETAGNVSCYQTVGKWWVDNTTVCRFARQSLCICICSNVGLTNERRGKLHHH